MHSVQTEPPIPHPLDSADPAPNDGRITQWFIKCKLITQNLWMPEYPIMISVAFTLMISFYMVSQMLNLLVWGKESWRLGWPLIHFCAGVWECFCKRRSLLCVGPHCPALCNGDKDPPCVRSQSEKTLRRPGSYCSHGRNVHSSLTALGLVVPDTKEKQHWLKYFSL